MVFITAVTLGLISSLIPPGLAWADEQTAATPNTAALARLHLLIPGAAGGGWDRTARGTGEALTKAGLVETVTYENLSGGGGAKAMAHLIANTPQDTLMVNSTPIVVRSLQKVFPQSFRDLVPIASIIGDYSVIAVREQSPHENLPDLLSTLRRSPRALAFGGGSVRGGTDHIFAALVAQGAGLDATAVKYIPYDAGGKAMAGLLSGEVQALSSGYSEVLDLAQQGWIRILCIAAEQPLSHAPDIPTCASAGAPGATFVNWRGFFAPPGTSAEQARIWQNLLKVLQTTPSWAAVQQRYGWVNLYHPGDEFFKVLEAQENMLQGLLSKLGFL